MSFWQRFGKPLASVGVAVVVTVYSILSDDSVSAVEKVAIVASFLNAVMVYIVPLVPEYRWAKSAVGAGIAGASVLATVIVGGLDTQELILVVLAVAQALGVAGAPAVSDNGVTSRLVTADGYGAADRPLR